MEPRGDYEEKKELMIKTWNDTITFKIVNKRAFPESIVNSYYEAMNQYANLLEEDVRPAFKQFDKDDSGSIDKSQLGELSK